MFVGHAMAAFALVAGTLALAGGDRQRALALGVVAAAFATLPDVDIVYALVGLLKAQGGVLAHASAFWETGNRVHRGLTHSLVVAPVVAALAGFAASHARSQDPLHGGVALFLVVSLIAVSLATGGPLAGVIVALFGLGAVAVARVVAARTDFSPRTTALAALVGLVSHPFGDLTTGDPPALFAPFEATLVGERVALSADPTVHLLGAFALELATVWVAVAVFVRLRGTDIRGRVDGRAAVGAAYALSVFVIPAPTLELSYPFVFSVLAVGFVGAVPRVELRRRRLVPPDALSAALTGLTAVTVAGGAYAVAYAVGVA